MWRKFGAVYDFESQLCVLVCQLSIRVVYVSKVATDVGIRAAFRENHKSGPHPSKTRCRD